MTIPTGFLSSISNSAGFSEQARTRWEPFAWEDELRKLKMLQGVEGTDILDSQE